MRSGGCRANAAAAPATVGGEPASVRATGKLGRLDAGGDPRARRPAVDVVTQPVVGEGQRCGFRSGDESAASQLMRPRITLDDIQELRNMLVGNMEKFEDTPDASKFRRSLQRARNLSSAVKQAQFLLGHVYQVTWLLLP